MDTIKSKIQKLLALAKDSTDEESHTALLQARKLMLKYNIYENDLVTSKAFVKNVVNEKVYRNKLLWWHKHLAFVIASNLRCNNYILIHDSYKSEIRFVGLEEDVTIATMLYNFARASVHYHSKCFLERPEIKRKWKRKHQFKNDYISGYLEGLHAKFLEQNKSESLDLLVTQDALVVDYYQSLALKTEETKMPQTAGDMQAWLSGYHDGQKFDSGLELIETPKVATN